MATIDFDRADVAKIIDNTPKNLPIEFTHDGAGNFALKRGTISIAPKEARQGVKLPSFSGKLAHHDLDLYAHSTIDTVRLTVRGTRGTNAILTIGRGRS